MGVEVTKTTEWVINAEADEDSLKVEMQDDTIFAVKSRLTTSSYTAGSETSVTVVQFALEHPQEFQELLDMIKEIRRTYR